MILRHFKYTCVFIYAKKGTGAKRFYNFYLNYISFIYICLLLHHSISRERCEEGLKRENVKQIYDMKFYEAPDFKKIDFTTDDVLTDGSILDPTDGLGNSGNVELGEIPLFGNN